MDPVRFAITEDGKVYRVRHTDRPLLLGHISCLAREETPLGLEVRAWWQARLDADEPGEILVIARRGDESCSLRVPIFETAIVTESQPDQGLVHELADALAAD